MRVAGFIVAFSLIVAASARGQGEMPEGKSSEAALRKLLSQLGGQDQPFPKLSKQESDLLQFLAKQAATDPGYRERIKQLVKDDPTLLERAKQTRPELVETLKNQFHKSDPPPIGDPPNRPTPDPFDSPFPKQNFPTPQPNPEQNRDYQEMVRLWEQAVGPLEATPAVRQALLDMFSGAEASKPGDKPFWADWDMTDKSGTGPQTSGMMKWLQGLNGGPGNNKLKMPKWMTNTGNLKPPSMKLPGGSKLPSLGFNGFSVGGVSGLGNIGFALVIAAAVALVAFLIWKYAPALGLARARLPKPLPGLGPWPIDPRAIADRDGLVKAFEYMSVLLCGDGARVWNHATIAEALREGVPSAAPFAEPLAKLYALARYAPLSDELSGDAIAEARGYLCQLAGVPA